MRENEKVFPYFRSMSSVEKASHVTVEEYLSYEDGIEGKTEFLQGEIFDMAGASLNHNRIASNVHYEIRKRLSGGGCEVFPGDFKIYMTDHQAIYYPDLSIFCKPIELALGRNDTATNPTLLVEILSDSTRHFNRGDKKHHYMSLPSLEEYVIVEQSRPLIDIYWRTPEGKWQYESFLSMDDIVGFNSLKINLPMAEIYANVIF